MQKKICVVSEYVCVSYINAKNISCCDKSFLHTKTARAICFNILFEYIKTKLTNVGVEILCSYVNMLNVSLYMY